IRTTGISADGSFIVGAPGNTGVMLNPRSSLRQPSPTLPVKTLEFPYDITALAIGGNYAGSLLFPDALTLAVYGGAGNTGVDPLVVTTEVLHIYVSRTPNIDPANPATYGFMTSTGVVNFADVRAHYDGTTDALTADGRQLYFLVHNKSGAPIATLGVIWEEYVAFLILPVEPGITTQPAVWPVMRDTAAYPWFSGP